MKTCMKTIFFFSVPFCDTRGKKIAPSLTSKLVSGKSNLA